MSDEAIEISEEILETPELETGQEEQEVEQGEEVVISLGEETITQPEKEPAPQWVKDMRKENKELKRKLKEVERSQPQQQAALPPVTPRPKLSDPDIDYDEDKFNAALDRWTEQKAKRDEAEAIQRRQQEEVQREWQKKLDAYNLSKAKLKVRDFDEAEEVILQNFSEAQQAIIVAASDNPALLIYALGKNPERVKEFSGITDLARFAWKAAQLETQVKVNKKQPPAPEKKVVGTGALMSGSDPVLERLRKEAEKSGDYTKVMQYKRSKR